MDARYFLSLSIFAGGTVLASTEARALTVPDTGSCTPAAGGSNGCLQISNSNSQATAFGLKGTSVNGAGVSGSSPYGNGVSGGSSYGNGVYSTSTYGAGVYGSSTFAAGLSGFSSNGAGVLGNSTNGPGVSATSAAGSGVYGVTNGNSSLLAGVYGYSATQGAQGVFGLQGGNDSGTGVMGVASIGPPDQLGNITLAANGYGVRGRAGTGVQGEGITTGVVGSSDMGVGVRGISNASTGALIAGSNPPQPDWSLPVQGIGVKGVSTATSGAFAGVYGNVPVDANADGGAVVGDAQMSWSVWAGNFFGDVQARGFYPTSDARLKKDIKDAAYGLPELMKLRPVSYKWKEGTDDREHSGFIAQEVQDVFPNAVRVGSKTGAMLTLDYSSLIPVAIKAIQQQQVVIARQEARIADLERRAAPLASSVVSDGTSLAIALLPLGLLVAHLRQKQQRHRAGIS